MLSILLLALCATATSNKILIRGGTVVNHDRKFASDVFIEDGKIKAVATEILLSALESEGVQIIDASGKYVMPGGIDPHTHLDMPFMGQITADDFYSGQQAALAGGTTMHIDFVLPVDGDLMKGYEAWKVKAKKSCMDYGFHMVVTQWNEKVSQDMETLVNLGGINSFKFFFAYKGSLMISDSEFSAAIEKCKSIGAIPMIHAENGHLIEIGQKRLIDLGITGPEGHGLSRPSAFEAEATHRAITIATSFNSPLYIVHVMSQSAMEEISRARRAGFRIVGEPVASGLSQDESETANKNFTIAAAHVMSPPIRKLKVDGEALKKALASGDLQLVATDHAVFSSKQKEMGKHDFRFIPNGVNGIEERMHVTYETMVNSGLVSLSDFVRITSTAAAQIFNIYPQKGAVLPGSDADLIIFDPKKKHKISAAEHHSRVDVNIYEGMEITGKVITTISQGKIVWNENKLETQSGVGRYIPMQPFGPLFDGLDSPIDHMKNEIFKLREAAAADAQTCKFQ